MNLVMAKTYLSAQNPKMITRTWADVMERFKDFTEVGTSHRFKHPQFLKLVINEALEQMFRAIMSDQWLPVRQIRIAMYNLDRLEHATDTLGPGRMRNAGARWMTRRTS